MVYLKLTSPVGPVFIRADAVVAVASVNDQDTSLVKTEIWVDYQNDQFNVREPIKEVMRKLSLTSPLPIHV